ncbi:(S)-benzoin forming benzil reductase [Bacillus sp. SD088]|uniref:(S)-benzoin forming benzil reductase n=1 Tax=Bacillus sp. SD088 TaxID=2782012 RepID=UPI001A96882E|nr:(S)-benzoin forming benzil reductase [Bacillus sp. SD088]MBO0992748.1 (S)-benzoin forming benzil reductase [Bacillus sp. SD088]
MKYFIITGTSRGIGESLVKQLLHNQDHHIMCISRNERNFVDIEKEYPAHVSYFPFDLNEIIGIDHLFQKIFTFVDEQNIDSIYLINNAGILSPIGPIEENESEEIIRNFNVNLLAPYLFTANFIRHTNHLKVDKRILNISSGSAKYLLPSQSAYSTAKAGVDSFSKSIHLEQKDKSHPVKIVSVYPGVIDTQLQTEIRSTSTEEFPHVELFRQIHSEGNLQTPDKTAEQLLELLFSAEYGAQTIVEELTVNDH